ncbi:aminoacyl-tRNA deacylase [Deinococcus yavapaiensis]|uniref:Cys-tRNA(Pro) deacylase n=1 Tax=Deinococcus yavapaiensis KR-236 TaxID=694435 RepID=A0A318S6V5_9DEIO|nr:YbaK/EbsC family protein [Deinococcus yavapaiensis]PYE52779.1 Cys-tRNA(Pro) deacylase [Deinococcus yavapaiensis KR-236]
MTPSDTAVDRLAAFLLDHGVAGTLVKPGVPTPTVSEAARALGVSVDRIVKSVLLVTNDGASVLVIAPGDRRVDVEKVARFVGASKLKLGSASQVLEATGYPAGGVPPVGHPAGLRVVLDASLLDRDELVGGGGSAEWLLRLTPREVVRVTGAAVSDVCRPAE